MRASKTYASLIMTNYTMSQMNFQTTPQYPEAEICSVCGRYESKNEMTTGPNNNTGELTLICTSHLRNSRQLINLLADYAANQRQSYGHLTILRETADAKFSY